MKNRMQRRAPVPPGIGMEPQAKLLLGNSRMASAQAKQHGVHATMLFASPTWGAVWQPPNPLYDLMMQELRKHPAGQPDRVQCTA